MMRKLLLRLGDGNFQQGFPGSCLEVYPSTSDRANPSHPFFRDLPAAKQLAEAYEDWKKQYIYLIHNQSPRRGKLSKPSYSPQECQTCYDNLVENLNDWLRELGTGVNSQLGSEVLLEVNTENVTDPNIKYLLHQLHWDCWKLPGVESVQHYVRLHQGTSPQIPPLTRPESEKNLVKVLGIFGDDREIDLAEDRKLIQNLEDRGARVKFLPPPGQESLTRRDFKVLWREGWDILIFCGHSSTSLGRETGVIHLNPGESLDFQEITATLNEAKRWGLKLAIFNSCDGLGLAEQLKNLGITTIVWREPVPTKIASLWLSDFLDEFTKKPDDSISRSVWAVGQSWNECHPDFQEKFPGVTGLPVAIHNGSEELSTWNQLLGKNSPSSNVFNIPDVENSSSSNVFKVPNVEVSEFIGRRDEVKQLERVILSGQEEKVCSIVGVTGLAGIGKTTLAHYFAKVYQNRFPDGVISVTVDEKSLTAVARKFVKRFGIDVDLDEDLEDDQDAATLMSETFANRQVLLIFDNATKANIKKLLPTRDDKFSAIITTRDVAIPSSFLSKQSIIQLGIMSEDECLKLLKTIIEDERNIESETELTAAKKIIKLVGNLPLAVKIVGTALRINHLQTISDYADLLENEKNALEQLELEDDELSVEPSINLSLKFLHKSKKHLKHLFACLSVCAPDGFALETAMAAAGYKDENKALYDLERLTQLSLLNNAEKGENRYVMHPLVRLVAKKRAKELSLEKPAIERHMKFMIKRVRNVDLKRPQDAKALGEDIGDIVIATKQLLKREELRELADYEVAHTLNDYFEKYGYWQQAIPLMSSFKRFAESQQDWQSVITFCTRTAKYHAFLDNFQEAETILEENKHILKKIPEEEEVSRQKAEVKWLIRRGNVLQKQKKFEEAEKDLDKALGIAKSLDLERQRNVAHSLAVLFWRKEQFDAAEKSCQEVIELNKRLDDPQNLVRSWQFLGKVRQYQGKFAEARDAYQQAIQVVDIERSPIELKFTAIYFNNFGVCLLKQRNYSEAEKAFRQTIDIGKQIDDLPQQAIGWNGLGKLFESQSQFAQAEEAFEKRIEIAKVLGDKSSLVIGWTCLGLVREQDKNFEGAKNAFRQVIEIAKKIPDLSEQVNGLKCLGRVLETEENYSEAENAFEQVIDIAEQINDRTQHSIGCNCLGRVFQKQGKFEDAEAYFQQAIDIDERENNQRSLVIGWNCLGELFREWSKSDKLGESDKLDKLVKAQDAFERGLSISKALKDYYQATKTAMILSGLFNNNSNKINEEFSFCLIAAESFQNINGDFESDGLIYMLRQFSQRFFDQENFTEALKAVRAGIKICVDTDNQKQLAVLKHRLGRIFDAQGAWENALQAFKEEIEIAEQIHDLSQQAIGRNDLGGVLQKQRKHSEAEEAFRQTIKIAEQINDLSQQAIGCNGLGGVLQKQRKYSEAKNAFRQTIDIAEQINDLSQQAIGWNGLGGVLQKQRKYSEAEKCLRRSYDLTPKNDKRGQAIITNRLGKVMAARKKNKQSDMYFRESIRLGEELGDRSHLAQAYTSWGQALSNRKDFENAVDKLSQAFEIDESLRNIEGLEIVLNKLTDALIQLGRQEEILEYCDRALKIAPQRQSLLRLRKKISE